MSFFHTSNVTVKKSSLNFICWLAIGHSYGNSVSSKTRWKSPFSSMWGTKGNVLHWIGLMLRSHFGGFLHLTRAVAVFIH